MLTDELLEASEDNRPLTSPMGKIREKRAKKRRPQRLTSRPRQLEHSDILAWADAHQTRTGHWPTNNSGPIPESPDDTWLAVDQALRNGSRGLQQGSSLSRLLKAKRGVRRHVRMPRLTVEQILAWADAHHRRTGNWPKSSSGSITGTQSETWGRVHLALMQGRRAQKDIRPDFGCSWRDVGAHPDCPGKGPANSHG